MYSPTDCLLSDCPTMLASSLLIWRDRTIVSENFRENKAISGWLPAAESLRSYLSCRLMASATLSRCINRKRSPVPNCGLESEAIPLSSRVPQVPFLAPKDLCQPRPVEA